MIRTHGLTKVFKKNKKELPITAVEDLTIEVMEGEVFGFLGPNGAGKTTTVRMLTSLIAPTSGTAVVNGYTLGKEDQQIRQTVGILTETPGMYDRLSAFRNLEIYARLYGVKNPAGQVEKFLRMLGLWDRRMDDVGSFSKGMRQKLAIARAMIHEPRVLFLDEPTSGLDPEASRLVRDFISDLKKEGSTIFICTHNLDEAERLCDRVGIFRTSLVTVDSPENLRKQLYGRNIVFHLQRVEAGWVDLLKRFEFVKKVQTTDNKLVVSLENPEEQNPKLVSALVEAGAQIQFVGELRHSLEDVYLQLIHQTDGNEKAQGKEAGNGSH